MSMHALAADRVAFCSTIEQVVSSKGLPFQDVFTGAELASVIERTVPEWRDRVFSPGQNSVCFSISDLKC